MDKAFNEFWTVKPKRSGSNPKEPARQKFLRAVASGVAPEKIIGAAREWARLERENGKLGTEYVAMAVTWLNQKRYEDFAPRCANDYGWHDEVAAKHGYKWDPTANGGEGSYVRAEA